MDKNGQNGQKWTENGQKVNKNWAVKNKSTQKWVENRQVDKNGQKGLN